MNSEQQHKIEYLFFRYCEGSITQEEMDSLNKIMPNNERVQDQYFDFLKTFIALDQNMQRQHRESIAPLLLQNELYKLAEEEKTAPAVEVVRPTPPRELIDKVIYPESSIKITKTKLFTTLFSAAALILVILYANYASVKQVYSIKVATLVDQIDAKWTDSKTTLKNGDSLWTNDLPLCLDKGIVKIQHDQGVEMVIEGPAKFAVGRSGVYVEYGRLYSSVSKSGLGFLIETPTSRFVDMGTEFGVQAEVNGSAELHVIKGKVQMFAGPEKKDKTCRVLAENEAVCYDSYIDQVKPIPFKSQAFVRQIDSKYNLEWRGQTQLNLADIIGGGDGFGSGSTNTWIDSNTGEYRNLSSANKAGTRSGTSGYHIFKGHAFIDGTFIPNGKSGPLQVSSAGHRLEVCPVTSGSYWMGILNTSWQTLNAEQGNLNNSLELDGVMYNTLSKPSISMHANQGITFDLRAIRDRIQGNQITHFTARAGISQSILKLNRWLQDDNGKMIYPKASFYVLVDGEIRMEGIDRGPRDTALNINIPISEKDSFLTLMVTQGTDGSTDKDWALFAEPFLHF